MTRRTISTRSSHRADDGKIPPTADLPTDDDRLQAVVEADLQLLNPGEVADIMRCDRSTAQRLMAEQAIRSRNIARPENRCQWRTTRAQIAAYLNGEERSSGIGTLRASASKRKRSGPALQSGMYREYRRRGEKGRDERRS
ncbi:MAG: hypothetical protein ABIR47_06730 [Candidatus Kapaibacterium sp.]